MERKKLLEKLGRMNALVSNCAILEAHLTDDVYGNHLTSIGKLIAEVSNSDIRWNNFSMKDAIEEKEIVLSSIETEYAFLAKELSKLIPLIEEVDDLISFLLINIFTSVVPYVKKQTRISMYRKIFDLWGRRKDLTKIEELNDVLVMVIQDDSLDILKEFAQNNGVNLHIMTPEAFEEKTFEQNTSDELEKLICRSKSKPISDALIKT